MNHRPKRRGLAMLLVLIAVGMAAVLTTAYLASRDNSIVVSTNASDATRARWSALSAVELAVAVLETESDWRTAHDDGTLIDDYALGDALVDVVLRDTVTGLPPTAVSTEVLVTARARIDGVAQVATARVTVPTADTLHSIDPDLSEFALFADTGIEVCDNATVGRWGNAPLADLGRRVAFGVRSDGAGAVNICSDAAALDTTVFHGPDASAFLVQNSSDLAVQEHALADVPPLPASPDPGVAAPGLPQLPLELIAGDLVLAADIRFHDVDIRDAALTLAGNVTVVADDAFRVENSTITIDGHVSLVVFGDLDLRDARIVLADDASSLTLFVDDGLEIRDTYVGPVLPDGTLAATDGTGVWIDPNRIQVYGTSADAVAWRLRGDTVFTGQIYNPQAALLLRETATVYGRVAAAAITLRDDAALFYDHTLDTLNGFTCESGQVLGADGQVHDAVLGLPTLSKPDLMTLAGDLDVFVDAGGARYGAGPANTEPAPTTGPTPRPVPVEWEVLSVGVDVEGWERKAGSGDSDAGGTGTPAPGGGGGGGGTTTINQGGGTSEALQATETGGPTP